MTALALLFRLFCKREAMPRNQLWLVCPCVEKSYIETPDAPKFRIVFFTLKRQGHVIST